MKGQTYTKCHNVGRSAMAAICLFTIAGLLARASDASGPALKSAEPRVVTREKLHYAGIRSRTPLAKLSEVIPKSLDEIFGWLSKKGIQPAGPPFIRYHVVDMARDLDVELCVPTGKPVAASGHVRGGALPAGKYVSKTVVGPPKDLVKANGDLQAWAKKRGIRLQQRETPRGLAFNGRAEFYLSDPNQQPDMSKWETEIIYLVDDAAARGASRQ